MSYWRTKAEKKPLRSLFYLPGCLGQVLKWDSQHKPIIFLSKRSILLLTNLSNPKARTLGVELYEQFGKWFSESGWLEKVLLSLPPQDIRWCTLSVWVGWLIYTHCMHPAPLEECPPNYSLAYQNSPPHTTICFPQFQEVPLSFGPERCFKSYKHFSVLSIIQQRKLECQPSQHSFWENFGFIWRPPLKITPRPFLGHHADLLLKLQSVLLLEEAVMQDSSTRKFVQPSLFPVKERSQHFHFMTFHGQGFGNTTEIPNTEAVRFHYKATYPGKI